ncbi:S8 family serine peptidase [Hymenobacter lutimineralis]|uniref:S8 family serine peptidase n=1 Tax=Hymenobacter lutimineralis TaxID=2606448 RepID=A0A5D6V5Z2_9BACT|nr:MULTISPECIES: S8 family serine peptidase [Hymenobacter]QIX62941.1 S8 family serine peptidase [Hymenobacter sp. BT18]TYZ10916.1 S8 family serine peptidase [Hymenobacter lutimineralis]
MNKSFSTPRAFSLLSLGLGLLASCSKEDIRLTEAAPQSVAASSAVATEGNSLVRRAHQYIIISSTNELPAALATQTQAANGTLTDELPGTGLALATSSDPDFAAKAARISGVRSVIHDFSFQGFNPEAARSVEAIAEADNTNPGSAGDNERFFPLQWGHTAIEAPEAWNTGARGAGALVAVLDGGFDLTHPDLKPNIVGSRSFVPGEPAQFARSTFSHGSHTAGTIAAADNGLGVIGVAPDAQLLLVKVLRDSGSGSFSWMIQGIYYAVAQQADVINMSLGAAIPRNSKFRDDNGTPDDATDDTWVNETKEIQELLVAIGKATTYATRQGTTVIASSGNDANNGQRDQDLVHIPSGAANVISISATAPTGWALNPLGTNLDGVATYTNYGTSDVDFAAPGGDSAYPGLDISTVAGVRQYTFAFDMVFSCTSLGRYTWSAGTSMAGPHAAGVAALVVGKNGGRMDPAKVLATLRASADDLGKPGRDPYYGYGRVNARRAVTQVP